MYEVRDDKLYRDQLTSYDFSLLLQPNQQIYWAHPSDFWAVRQKRSISKYWADFEQQGPTVDNLNIVFFFGKLQTAAIKRQKSKNMHLLQCSALVVSSFIPQIQIFFLLYDISRVHMPRGGHVFSSDCRKLNSKFKNSNSSAHVAMWFARTAAPMCQHVHR